LDATTLLSVRKHKSSLDRERFWASLPPDSSLPSVGVPIDYLSKGKDEFSTDYSPSFHFFKFTRLLTIRYPYVMDIEWSSPKNLMKNIKTIVKSLNIMGFIHCDIHFRNPLGFVESFSILVFIRLGSPKYLLGLTLTTGLRRWLPFYWAQSVCPKGRSRSISWFWPSFSIWFGSEAILWSNPPFWCIPFEVIIIIIFNSI